MIRISVGHSIFNRNCKVNVGVMLLEFDGGGHPGAGACRIHISGAESVLKEIVRILADNKENESLQ
jgi:nanoRNase/pAp phosphatase (c-di-AMP/oligoRNAs hydrolase)